VSESFKNAGPEVNRGVLDYLLDILFGKLRGLAFQFDLA
jgi:hypothetical protein